ncbi:Transmembrane domain-containing protein [Spironucleus salmonicida]|uniref:Transmembrane domain-containing protein n=1 Tax=Spironucleus salmonicida TaxID=348837 RepID=V6LU55_9EUKA|nr:Transmembrane domain-containing protein [Spironucleus salmonicida]|eukprot:EST47221.1 Transmembrane domain-containing protein [Spironucleus salmonicida]
MANQQQVDFTYLLYWQVLQYLSLSILLVAFIFPSKGTNKIHPQGFYLVCVCLFIIAYITHSIILTLSFQEYFQQFLTFLFLSKFLYMLVIIMLVPLRGLLLNWYSQSPFQAMMKTPLTQLPHLLGFIVIEMIELANTEEQRNQATSFIYSLLDDEIMSKQVVLIVIFGYNIILNYIQGKSLEKEINDALQTTDPQQLSYLIDEVFNVSKENQLSISPTSYSVITTLSKRRVYFTMSLLIIGQFIEIIKIKYSRLIFHLYYPLEWISLVILFMSDRDSPIPETLQEVLLNIKDRKAFQLFLQQRQQGQPQFQFLVDTAQLRNPQNYLVNKQLVQQIYQQHFNNLDQQCYFSQQTQLVIRNKFMKLSQLKRDEYLILFNEAEQESIEFLQQMIIPAFYKSKLGAKLLAYNAFNEIYSNIIKMKEMDQFREISENPLIAFVRIFDDHDASKERFKTQSERIIQSTKSLIYHIDLIDPTQQNQIQEYLNVLNADFMKLSGFVRNQEHICGIYASTLSSQIGYRPFQRLQIDQKQVYNIKQPVITKDSKQQFDDTISEAMSQTPTETSITLLKGYQAQDGSYRQFLIDIPKVHSKKQQQKFSQLSAHEQQQIIKQLIKLDDFLSIEDYDPYILQKDNSIDYPLEIVLLTSLNTLGLLIIFDLPIKSIQLFSKIVSQDSSKQPYYNVMRSMLSIQTLTAFIYSLQGSFEADCKKIFSKELVLAVILAASCSSIAHSGLDDHSIISVQHALSIIYNDRNPNQRCASTNGWNIILKSSLLGSIPNDTIKQIRKKFIDQLISFDGKNFDRLIAKMNNQKFNNKLIMDQLELDLVVVLKNDEDQKLIDSARKKLTDEASKQSNYSEILLNVVLYLSIFSDNYRKRETLELLGSNLQQQLKKQQQIETFALPKSYLPHQEDVCQDIILPLYQLYIIDNIQEKGLKFLKDKLKEWQKLTEIKIRLEYVDFYQRIKQQLHINRSYWFDILNSDKDLE